MDAGDVSKQLPLGRISTMRSPMRTQQYRQNAHTDDVVHVTGEVCVENLDCHANPFVHTFPYGGRTSICGFYRALRAIWDVD